LLQAYKPQEFSTASTQVLQERFFRDAINFYKRYPLTKLNISKANPRPEVNRFGELIVTKEQLSDIIGINKQNFIVSCGRGNDWMFEIQICLRFQEDLSITLENCSNILKETPYPTKDTCPDIFRLIGYKPRGAKRVTAKA